MSTQGLMGDIKNLTGDIKKRSDWAMFMGILTVILGVFLITYPMATATITTLLFGWTLILVGIAQFIFALHTQTIGRFLLKIVLGALYVITGVLLAFFPIAGAAALTALLGTLLLAGAALAAVVALQMRPVDGWGWILFEAVCSLLMGILILARWPSSSVWAIGTLVGVSVLMGGISRIMIGARIRSGIGGVETWTRPRKAA